MTMPRHLFPGIFFLFSAFVLSFLVSISLPSLPTVDIARSHFPNAAPHVSIDTESINQIRFGVWAYCIYGNQSGDRTCIDPGHGYTVHILGSVNNVTIGPGATRGLAVHPVAAGVTFIALLCSFSSHVTLVLIASLLSFLAALLTLIALAIDLSLYIIVHNRVNNLDDVLVHSVAGPGLFMTFASLLLLLSAGGIVYFGRRRSRMSGAIDYGQNEKPRLLNCF